MPPFLENLDELETDYKDKLEKDDNSDGKTFDPFKNLFLAIISSDILVKYPWINHTLKHQSGLTLRSRLACRPVQRYSIRAVIQAMPSPASSTTKIPPTLAILREAAFPLSDFSCREDCFNL